MLGTGYVAVADSNNNISYVEMVGNVNLKDNLILVGDEGIAIIDLTTGYQLGVALTMGKAREVVRSLEFRKTLINARQGERYEQLVEDLKAWKNGKSI